MNKNLNDRLFEFAVNVLKFLPKLPKTAEMSVVRYQLAKSSSSSGVNYWLRIIKSTLNDNKLNEDLNYLIDESGQLKKILGSIVTKTNK